MVVGVELGCLLCGVLIEGIVFVMIGLVFGVVFVMFFGCLIVNFFFDVLEIVLGIFVFVVFILFFVGVGVVLVLVLLVMCSDLN